MSTRIRLIAATVAAAIGTATGTVALSSPAGAVQTTTWGLMAAASGHTYRSTIQHPANGSTVNDAVIVFNRSDQPITVHIYPLDATYTNAGYQFGPPTQGLAARIRVSDTYVTLTAHEQVRVPISIRMPRGVQATELAGIAAEASAINDGALSIQQQLVVLVKATHANHPLPLLAPKDLGLWASLALLVVLGAAALAERERRRSRRSLGSVAVMS